MKLFLCFLISVCLPASASPAGRFVPLDLSAVFNNDGIATADNPDDGNFDAIGTTQPATFNFADEGFPKTPEATLAGVLFRIGSTAAGARNNAVARGQAVPVPSGRYTALYVLGACTNGSYSGTWTLDYADGTPRAVPLRFSDWCTEPGPNEAVALRAPFRYMVSGGKSPDAQPRLFVQRIVLDASRALRSVTLPDQWNTHVFALTLREGDMVTPVGLPPAKAVEETGPRLRFFTDAAHGAMVVNGGPVRVTARAQNLSPGRLSLMVSVLQPDGRALATRRVAVDWRAVRFREPPRLEAAVSLPQLPAGYYRVVARLSGDSAVAAQVGLVSAPEARAAWRPNSLFGVNEGFDQADPATARKRAWLVRRAGIRWVRQGFGWSDVEPEPGRWTWAAPDRAVRVAAGEKLHTLGLLAYWAGWSQPFTPDGYAAYARYAARVAARYKTVTAWEIWNEPNIFYWKGTRAQYATLFRTAAPAVRRANPKARVAGMVTAFADVPFIRDVLNAGARPDIVSIHPYRGPYPDQRDRSLQYDGGRAWHTTPEAARTVHATVRAAGGPRPLWYSEIGWWTGNPRRGGKTEVQQANALVRSYVLAMTSGVDKVFWYAFVDAGTNPDFHEHHFGLLRTDLSPKPSYAALGHLARRLDGATLERRLEAGPGVWAARFRRGNERVTVLWATQGKATARWKPTRSRRAAAFTWDGRPRALSAAPRLDETPLYIVEP